MSERIFCIVIGYLFGCFLTADLVARHITGKSACEIGTKNPGMANIHKLFGTKWAAVTLLGDVLKTALPCFCCRYFLFASLGQMAILYTGLGAALGHAFPFWNKFRGGRSVAVSCAYIVFFSPLWGLAAELIGLAAVFVTGYLAVGTLLISSLYLVPAFLFYGREAGLVAMAGTALLLLLHRDSLARLFHKTEPKTVLFAKLKKRL